MANSLISVIRLKLDDPTVNNTTEIEVKQAIDAATKVKQSFCNDGNWCSYSTGMVTDNKRNILASKW